jgi:hypothetical protein
MHRRSLLALVSAASSVRPARAAGALPPGTVTISVGFAAGGIAAR